jgi:hypothetical protein
MEHNVSCLASLVSRLRWVQQEASGTLQSFLVPQSVCGCAHRALLVLARRRVVLLRRSQAVARLGGIR